MNSVRVTGVEEAVRNLERLKTRVQQDKALKPAYMAAAEIIRDEAELRAPVDTGFLKGHMLATWYGRGRYALVGPSKSAYYGEFQERGTSKMRAQPFLRPALDARRVEAINALAAEMRKSIKEAV